MSVIDEKGRLFGKINVIDFLAILFVFLLLPMFYLGYKILNRPVKVDAEADTRLSVSIDIFVLFKNLGPEAVKLISTGDKEIDSHGNIIGEILEIGKIESNFIDVKLSETNIVTKEDAQRKQITAKLKIIGKLEGNDILYKEKRVKIGSELNFETTKYVAKGTVIPGLSPIVKISRPGLNPITLDVLFINLSPETANLISAGDFEVNKDGETIAKILNVGQIEPYSYRIDLGGGGNYITKTNPNKKQVQVKMEIMGGVEGNAFYFRDRRIALDSGMEFNTNKYRVEGVVSKEPLPIVKALVMVPITLDVLFINLSPETANLISAGDFEVNKDGETIVNILNVGPIEPYSYRIDLGGGNYITKTNPNKKQVQVKMEIMGGVEGNAFYFRDKRIAIDSGMEFNTNKYRMKGAIVQEPRAIKKFDKKWLLLKAKFTNLMPELVDCIKPGDEERDIISGDLIAKIKSVISIQPIRAAVVLIPDTDKKLSIIADDSVNKDMVLLIEASTIKIQKSLTFKDVPVKVGNNLSLKMDKYDISGTIIGISEIDN